MSSELDAFIGAQNFCTGSQTDYSTCIANNMRFSKYMDDTYTPGSLVAVKIDESSIPYVYGKSYVDLKPIAIANVLTRMLETNDFGAVKFRCLDVYDQPRLPLPSLQDLGIASSNILNIIEVPEVPDGHDDQDYYEGVPVYDNDKLNCLNFTIGFSTAISKALTLAREIRNIINNHLNYYDLPDKAIAMMEELDKADLLMLKAKEYADIIAPNPVADTDRLSIYTTYKTIYDELRPIYVELYDISKNDIHDPLVDNINDNTDFSTFDFDITNGVAETITELEKEDYPKFLASSMYMKYLANIDVAENTILDEKLLSTYSGLFLDIYPGFFTYLSTFYSSYNELTVNTLRNSDMLHYYLELSKSLYTTLLNAFIDPADPKAAKKQAVKEQFEVVVDIFDTHGVIDQLSEDIENNNTVLDAYFNDYGYNIQIQVSELASRIHDLYEQPTTGLTEVNFGTNYKDSGKFYYADIAYIVGFTKIEKIYAIKIDDEYYTFEDMTVSESGCTKYTFTRHVLPTYDYTIEMYVYAGVANQPYCPTINTYHNFATSSYSGMFTKQEGDEVGLYVYKGYRPMEATVSEVIKLGALNLNSINLNDPSIDPKSYEMMLMKEIKNLTNASTINGEPISTDDLKYYTASELTNPEYANNYPTMGVIEFKKFPLGSSLHFPKITVLLEATDIISKEAI